MKRFSLLYKKMSERSEILQSRWQPQNKKIYYYMEKGEYEGLVYEFNFKIIDKKYFNKLRKNHTWLPTTNDLERIIHSENSSALIQLYKLCKDKGVGKISSPSERDEAIRILTLKFVMGMFGYFWDDEKGEEWKEKRCGNHRVLPH